MKPTRRPLSIAEILAEGNREIYQARDLRNQYTSRSRLSETLLFEAEMSPDNVPSALASELESDLYEMAQKVRSDFDKILYKKLAPMVEKAGGEKVSANVLQDDLEDFDLEGLMELQQDVTNDIISTLSSYAEQIALLASHAKLAGIDATGTEVPVPSMRDESEYMGEGIWAKKILSNERK